MLKTLYFDVHRGCAWLCVPDLLNILSVDSTQGKQTRIIYAAITELILREYIYMKDLNNNDIVFNQRRKTLYKVFFFTSANKDISGCEGGVTLIPECNLLNITRYIKEHKGIKKYKLLKFYCLIARGCSNTKQTWKLSHRYFEDTIGISSNTVTEWSALLESIDIVSCNADYIIATNGNIQRACTTYTHKNYK